MAFVESTMEALVTSDRTTGQTVLDSDGKVKNAPHNLIPNCDLSDTGDWTHDNLDSVAASGTSPSGKTAYLLTEDSSAGNHRVYDAMSFTGGGTYSLVVDVKANGRDTIKLSYSSDAYGSSVRWEFDLGAVSVTQETGGTEDSAAITLISDGWYRCVMTAAATATDTASRVSIFMTDSGTTSYTGDGASGVYLSRPRVYKSAIHGYSGTDPQGMQLATDGSDYVETTSGPVYQLGRAFDGNAACLGMQSFEGRTNLLTQSGNIAHSNWTKNDSVVTANGTVLGGLPWFTLTDDVGGGTGNPHIAQNVTLSSGVTTVLSVFVEEDQLDWVFMNVNGIDVNMNCYFNLGTGAVGTSTADDEGIVDYGNGIYRCWIAVSTTTDLTGTCRVYVAEADGDDTVDKDGTSSINLSAIQIEAGAFPTPYIPTLSASVARGADDASLLTSSFGYNASEGTVLVTWTAVNDVSDDTVFSFMDGTSANLMRFYSTGTDGKFQVVAASATQASITAGTWTTAEMKSGSAYKANDFATSIDGATAVTDTSGTVPGNQTTLALGKTYSTSLFLLNGYIKSLVYYPSRLVDATLERIST